MNQIRFLLAAAIVLVALVAFREPAPVPVKDPNVLELPPLRSPVNRTDPPCLQMYYYIEKYADSFNIPKRFAYGIASHETGYKGPFHWHYNPALSSSAGAQGAMQVMVGTAKLVNHETVSASKLRNNIEYNVMTSMKLLRKLHNLYGDWQTTFGAYNCGYPCINGYAVQVYNHQINWK
jgi:soluble lytic murein transglycosylase-like protein